MTSMQMVLIVVGVLNVVVFLVYGHDKRMAVKGRVRVPESWLLGVAVLGGSFGAFLGQQMFRHKTRKLSFMVKFYLIVLLQIVVAIWWFLGMR